MGPKARKRDSDGEAEFRVTSGLNSQSPSRRVIRDDDLGSAKRKVQRSVDEAERLAFARLSEQDQVNEILQNPDISTLLNSIDASVDEPVEIEPDIDEDEKRKKVERVSDPMVSPLCNILISHE
jgi:hypothetical protein